MPYPHAKYYVLAVIGVILLGFWPSYFAALSAADWQFHVHGIAASLWVLLVFAQSWTGQHKARFPLHRTFGQASLYLFPFLTAGLCAIIDRAGKGFVAHDGPVRMLFGGSFALGMAVALAAYVVVFYRALKFRRSVWVHAGYMLTTPLILFESPFSRILNAYLPPLVVAGPADFPRILSAILWSMALELVFIGLLWLRYRQRARPFLVAGGFIAAQIVTMGWFGDLALSRNLMAAIGHTPSTVMVSAGFLVGALTSWAGWQAGKPTARPAPVLQPA